MNTALEELIGRGVLGVVVVILLYFFRETMKTVQKFLLDSKAEQKEPVKAYKEHSEALGEKLSTLHREVREESKALHKELREESKIQALQLVGALQENSSAFLELAKANVQVAESNRAIADGNRAIAEVIEKQTEILKPILNGK